MTNVPIVKPYHVEPSQDKRLAESLIPRIALHIQSANKNNGGVGGRPKCLVAEVDVHVGGRAVTNKGATLIHCC